MKAEKINIEMLNLFAQKPTEVKEAYIIINDFGIIYNVRFTADEMKDENDEMQGWEEKFTCLERFAKKSCITGIEFSYSNTNKCWSVWVITIGFDEDLAVYFKTESEARLLFDKLYNYLNQPELIFHN